MQAYIDATVMEARLLAISSPESIAVHTIFIGGGTPSILPIQLVNQLMSALREVFMISPHAEITLEANPGTLSLAYLDGLRDIGFNRLSLGVQSAHPADLRLLGRIHDYPQVIQSVQWARQAGFDNLNLDLIFGVPSQTLQRWQQTVNLILGLKPEHLSLYALTVEPGTRLYAWVSRGLLNPPDDDLSADMYEWASARLGEAGFQQYEISNWAQLDPNGRIKSCRHNLQYWRNLPYLGLGAGAHGSLAHHRLENVTGIVEYIQRMQSPEVVAFPFSPALKQSNFIDRQTEMEESMLMGLRLTHEGVSRQAFLDRFGVSIDSVFGRQMDELQQKGLLEVGEVVRLTPRARLLGNQVFMQFIP